MSTRPKFFNIGLVQELHKQLTIFLDDTGNSAALLAAARNVVAARYYQGDDGWDKLKEAIGALEDLVGRPT